GRRTCLESCLSEPAGPPAHRNRCSCRLRRTAFLLACRIRTALSSAASDINDPFPASFGSNYFVEFEQNRQKSHACDEKCGRRRQRQNPGMGQKVPWFA